MDKPEVPQNADPRDNPRVPVPPPREPIRNAMMYALILAAAGLTAAVLMGVLDEAQIIAALGTAGSILAAVWLLMERVRSMVNSPATSAQQAEVAETLAEAVLTADQTGSVPYKGTKAAKKVLGEAVDLVVPPGLMAEALKWGLSQNFVLAAGVELTKQAIAAAKEAAKRAATFEEGEAVIKDLGKEL